jgi:hypothetical protein
MEVRKRQIRTIRWMECDSPAKIDNVPHRLQTGMGLALSCCKRKIVSFCGLTLDIRAFNLASRCCGGLSGFKELKKDHPFPTVVCPEIFSGGEGSTNSVEDREQRERGSGGCSPVVRGSALSRLLRMYFPRNYWEFGSDLSKLRIESPPPVRHCFPLLKTFGTTFVYFRTNCSLLLRGGRK